MAPSQQECFGPTYLTLQLENRSGGFYFNNWGADPAPKKAVTTTEQIRGLIQQPVEVQVSTIPISPCAFVCVCMCVCVCVRLHACTCAHVLSCPGSSVHGIFQVRILEWVAISSWVVSFPTQGSNLCLLHHRWTLYPLSH